MLNKLLTLLFTVFMLVCLDSTLTGQNYQLNNGLNGSTVITCSGNFFDSGGPSGNYNNNNNLTVTFCPAVPGQVITVSFSQLQLENGYDRLRVYDGPNTSSQLIANNTGNVGTVSYTSSFGCLTFRFTSDGSVTQAGWQAVISCAPIPPCSGITPGCPSGFPDDCASACPLSLGTPANCNNPANNVFCIDNIGASQEAGSSALNGCSLSGSIPSNPYDIWYSFTATSSAINISLIGLNDPSIALYQGSCGNLTGVGCATGAGFAYLTVSSLEAGQTYYLQIAVSDPADVGDISLNITSSNPCNPCLQEANLDVVPAPVNGGYAPGTVVQFCYQMTEWSQVSSNWFHGVGLTLGDGWDPASLNVISLPDACGNSGAWGFYNSVTGNSSGLTVGPGFFFETNGSMNGNPGNNYGDYCPNVTTPWVFCWELTVADCGVAGNNAAANLFVTSYGDNETGSWSSGGCQFDPIYTVFATVDCCEEPTLLGMTPATCGVCDGEISIQANGTAPYSYTCTDGNGVQVANGNSVSPLIDLTGLCGNDDYTIQTTDATGCSSYIEVAVTEPGAPTATISGGANLCPGQTTDIEIVLTGTGPWTLSYSVDGVPQTVNVLSSPLIFTNAADGVYELIAISDASCSTSASGTQTVSTSALSANISGGGTICAGENTDLSVSFTGSGPWTIVPTFNGNPLPAQTISANPFNVNVSQAGTYSLISVSNSSCTGTVSGSAQVILNPAVNAVISGTLALCSGESGNLQVSLTGTPPWNVVYEVDGVAQAGISTATSPLMLTVSQAGTYSLTSVSNAQCDGNISGTGIVTVHDGPTVSGVTETCTGFSYTVSFTIQDGDPTSYSVTGSGTLVGNTFTSDPIPSGSAYSFLVSDAFGCPAIDVAGNYNCSCPSAAVLSGIDNICAGETGELSIALAGTGPWTLIYALNGVAQPSIEILSTPFALTGLSAGTYTLVSVEDQSCIGSVSGSGTITQAPAITASISGGGNICAGETINLEITCTGTGPWQVIPLLDGVPQSPLNIATSPFSYSVDQAGNYSLQGVDNASCAGTVSGSASVTLSGPITANISGDLDLCSGESGTLTITLAGEFPWNIIYAIDGVPQPMIITSDPVYTLDVTSEGDYSLVSVTSGSCTGIVSGNASVLLHESPSVVNIIETCTGFTYTVSFTIQDGDAATYDVTGAGTLVGNTFTSNPITSGIPYNFDVSDSYSCSTVNVSGTVNCGCPANAILSGSATVCEGEFASLTLTLEGSGPWTVQYTQDGIAQTALNVLSSPYQMVGLSPGVYELSSVEDQACIGSVSGSGTISTYPSSSAVLSGSGEVCPGEEVDFNIALTGTAPWYIQYTIDGVNQGLISTSAIDYTFSSSIPGGYSLTSVSDAYCSSDISGSGSLDQLTLPTATLSGDQDLCEGESAAIEIQLTGVSPFSLDYSIDGIPQGTLTINSSTYTLQTSQAGNYTLTEVSDSHCAGTVSGNVQLDIHPLPHAEASGNIELCEGEVGTVEVSLDGFGPWVLEYTIAGAAQTALVVNTSPYSLTLDQDGPYQLIDVSDAFCDGEADGNISAIVHPLPTALLPADQSICPDEVLSWEIALSGTGPWDLMLQLDGSDWQNLQSDSNTLNVESTSSGQISLSNISDLYCEADDTPTFTIDANAAPIASLIGGSLLCEGSTADIEVQFTGTAPFTFEYSLNGIAQGLNVVNADSYLFPLSEAGNIAITSLEDLNCAGDAGPSLSVISQELPSAQLSGDALLCQGESAVFPMTLEGVGPFDISYAINGETQTMINTDQSYMELTSAQVGNYTLISVTDQFCSGTVSGQATLAYYPDITIQGLTDTSICIGSSIALDPIVTGGQGTGYEFLWTGTDLSDQSQSTNVSPITSANYLFEVNDACNITYSELITVDVANSEALFATILNGPICGPGDVFIESGNSFNNGIGFCYWYAQGDTIYDCNGAHFSISGQGLFDLGFYAEPVPGCISDTVFQDFIEVLELPHADFDFNPSAPTNVENLIQFIDLSTQTASYEWYLDDVLFSESAAPSLELPYSDLTEYWPICLVATHENSCTDTLCTSIATSNELLVFIPSAFTPDDDGLNDQFIPVLRSVDIDKYSLSIFDRWGNMIWQTTDPQEAWNGAGEREGAYYASDGVYSWKIHVRRKGTTDEREYIGLVTLLR